MLLAELHFGAVAAAPLEVGPTPHGGAAGWSDSAPSWLSGWRLCFLAESQLNLLMVDAACSDNRRFSGGWLRNCLASVAAKTLMVDAIVKVVVGGKILMTGHGNLVILMGLEMVPAADLGAVLLGVQVGIRFHHSGEGIGGSWFWC